MGSSVSKAGRVGSTAARRYPPRDHSGRGPLNLQRDDGLMRTPKANSKKDNATTIDGGDSNSVPDDFSRRLHEMGVVQPSPTFSPSSTAQSNAPHDASNGLVPPQYPPARYNTTLSVLEARQSLQEQATDDFVNLGQSGRRTKRFIDMRTLIDAMKLRDRHMSDLAIEKHLHLHPGTVRKLGRHGILSYLSQN